MSRPILPAIDPSCIFSYHIRWITPRDIPAVVAIESASFSRPWTEADFRRALRHRDTITMVATSPKDDALLGFVVYRLSAKELEILNLAVGPAHRRKQVGSALMGKLYYKLGSHRRERLMVDVRESNTLAQVFFRACGMKCVSVVRGMYEAGDGDGERAEDGYRFEGRAG